MGRVLVYSPHLVTGVALVALLEARGFEGVLSVSDAAGMSMPIAEPTPEAVGEADYALWDLASYRFHYPLPPALPTLALVGDHEHELADLLRLGYRGVIRSFEGPDIVQRALLALRRGEIWAERQVIMQALRPKESHKLTTQEHRVLTLVSQGLSNKDIASALGVGEKTVKGYISKLFEKMGAKNRTDLIVQHLKNHL